MHQEKAKAGTSEVLRTAFALLYVSLLQLWNETTSIDIPYNFVLRSFLSLAWYWSRISLRSIFPDGVLGIWMY
jgi:hypothetical protein